MEASGKRANELFELCFICQSDFADGCCSDCKEYMCEKCFQDHKKAKPCRQHVLAPLSQAADIMSQKIHEEKCKIHKTEDIRYYCRRHDVVGCGDCIVSKHVGCKPEMIKDLAVNFEENFMFKAMLKRMHMYEAEKNEIMKHLDNNITQNKVFIEKALDEIRRFRQNFNDYFDNAEKIILGEAMKQSKDNEIMFSQLQQKLAAVTKEIEDLREKLDTNLHQGEDLFIRVVQCKGIGADVRQTIAEIKSRNILKPYMFKPEQRLNDMLTSNMRLGNVQLSENMKPSGIPQEKNTSLPDPRSAGFDVGRRVNIRGYLDWMRGTGTGTIVSVDPVGWVNVSWDQGRTSSERAGYGGDFSVELL